MTDRRISNSLRHPPKSISVHGPYKVSLTVAMQSSSQQEVYAVHRAKSYPVCRAPVLHQGLHTSAQSFCLVPCLYGADIPGNTGVNASAPDIYLGQQLQLFCAPSLSVTHLGLCGQDGCTKALSLWETRSRASLAPVIIQIHKADTGHPAGQGKGLGGQELFWHIVS